MTADDPNDEKTQLMARIHELEGELADRERDLAVFRSELIRANAQLEKFIQQMAGEIRLISQIQKWLVPTEFPNIPGFEFSSKFMASLVRGGDYFDIFEHEDKFRFGIVVANSTGYAMSSLLLSILLKMTGQLEARRGAQPEKMMTMLATDLAPNISGTDKANVFYAVIDRRNYEMKMVSAGSTLVFHINHSTQQIRKLTSEFPAFDKDFSATLSSTSVPLNSRDRLVICTEGLLKVQNAKGELFGEERLYKAILSAPKSGVHELRNEIFYQIEKFAQTKELPQDVTVLVTEVKDRVIKLALSP